MKAQLHIGQVAELLEVTPKTIRHYQRVGLLAEPARTAAGYRLYSAADLVRLLRIRRLQALGLSLAQIRQVLGEPDQEHSLREVLAALLETCSAQIRALEARRDRIRALLAEPGLDALDRPDERPAMLRWTDEQLGHARADVSPAVMEQDVKIFGLIESFDWPEGYQERMREATAQFLANPEHYRLLVDLAERLAGLAELPEDAPEVEHLVDDVVQSGVADLIQSSSPSYAAMPHDTYGAVLGELMLSALAPAQRRFMERMRERTRTGDGGGAG